MEYSSRFKYGQSSIETSTRSRTTKQANIEAIMNQELNGHREIKQGVESHLVGCKAQLLQTSLLSLLPHLDNKIRVIIHTSSSFSTSRFSILQSSLLVLFISFLETFQT